MRVIDGTRTVRLAALGDLHCTKKSQGAYQELFSHAAEQADVLLLCGDLTDFGLPEEAQVLASELRRLGNMPVVGVLGNHDYESGREEDVRRILTEEAGVQVLDGQSCTFHGVGFAGVKGFLGGFGERMLQAWGERAVKRIVREALEETEKLESALARLHTQHRIVLMHYAPIRATVEGEPPEVIPYLGCSRLAEPIHRHPVTAVVHGHAHHGSPEGATENNVPVYNVSIPVLRRSYPDRPAFRIMTVQVSHE